VSHPRAGVVIVTTRAVGTVGGPSYAHPKPAEPNTDAVVSSSPTEIWLSFKESLAVKFSHIELSDQYELSGEQLPSARTAQEVP
jgi:methionine-rich copper-binding protein CopC